MKHLFIQVFSLILLLKLDCHAFTYDYNFRHFDKENGLTNNTISTIFKDQNQNIWVGTHNGLNRIIGNTIIPYLHISKDSTSIGSNFIHNIFEDNSNKLWIMTDNGVSQYTPLSDNFIQYELKTNSLKKYVSAMTQDTELSLWCFRYNGDVYRKKQTKSTFRKIHIKNKSIQYNHIKGVLSFKDRAVVYTEFGIFILDLIQRKIINAKPILEGLHINKIILSPNQKHFWIATEKLGVIQTDLNFNILYKVDQLPSNKTRDLAFYDKNKLWIGTFKGLSIYNTLSKEIQVISENKVDPFSLSHNSIHSIFIDHSNKGAWLGTYFGGVNYHQPSDLPFHTLNNWISYRDIKIPGKLVNCLQLDSNKNLWIGTSDEGICEWDIQNKILRQRNSKGQQRVDNNIQSIKSINDSLSIIGTHANGLTILNQNTSRWLKISTKTKHRLIDNHIYDILIDHNKHIWVGTWKGLVEFDLAKETVTPHTQDKKGNRLTSEQISVLFQDRHERIWIGTYNGLNLFHSSRDLFFKFTTIKKQGKLSDNRVSTIQEDHDGRIWVGTHSGINCYDPITKSFYTPKPLRIYNGSTINTILSDKKNNIWFSTTEGVVSYNTQTEEVNLYTKKDGILNTQFINNSGVILKDSTIGFGGINGITMFKPIKAEKDPNNKLNVYKLIGYNKEHTDSTVFHNLHSNEKITFLSNHYHIKAYFSTTQNYNAHRVKYQYKLLNQNKNWSPKSGKHEVSFFELKDGHYTLDIKAQNNSSLPLIKTRIHIEIKDESNRLWWGVAMPILFIIFLFFGKKIKIHISLRKRNNQDTPTVFIRQKEENRPQDQDIKIEKYLEDHGHYDLLFVSQEIKLRENYGQLLKDHFNIHFTSSDVESMNKLTSKEIDIILILCNSPQKTKAIELCKKIKQNIKFLAIPLIIICNDLDENSEIEFIRKGVDHIISPPFSSQKLYEYLIGSLRTNIKMKQIFQTRESTDENIKPITKEQQFLQNINKVLQRNYHRKDFSVDTFADLAGMSRSNLHIKLKSVTGESTSSFVMKFRIQKGLELLKTEQYTITEISDKIGFNNPNYFSSNFRKHFGLTPTDYLNRGNKI
ncbi:helix-turn-helix domain-containing protein [Halosquirtibacter xylanolyticus]|uniref:two-component regulator propeller domain-containing protein n=1 Tax=Halosquirtibacter xylanolyticus TaxID=3374599 RepID=UPI00374A7B72|nr:helix-turn-helix domain-containing protein [Prolixibacteraceae bacterium]